MFMSGDDRPLCHYNIILHWYHTSHTCDVYVWRWWTSVSLQCHLTRVPHLTHLWCLCLEMIDLCVITMSSFTGTTPHTLVMFMSGDDRPLCHYNVILHWYHTSHTCDVYVWRWWTSVSLQCHLTLVPHLTHLWCLCLEMIDLCVITMSY